MASPLGGHEPVPAIYGPSGDVKWDEADPTYSLEAARSRRVIVRVRFQENSTSDKMPNTDSRGGE